MLPIYLFLFLFFISLLSLIPSCSAKCIRLLGIVGGIGTAIGIGYLIQGPLLGFPQMWQGTYWVIDQFAALLSLLIGFLYLMASLVSYRYLHQEHMQGTLNLSQLRIYYVCLPLFILAMLVTVWANNIGILWIGLEATTLATTLLVALYHKEGAVEAAWKYIIICSTGIALGLLGILMVQHAGIQAGLHASEALQLHFLREHASELAPEVMRWAFIFIFIGFGVKVGFVPFHTWLPDAHGKTPSPISALLSGVLLNVAFYVILRFKFLTDASLTQSMWTERFFLIFGFLSIILPVFLILIQKNYKRLLAYSSIEHMGLMAFAVGLGPFGMIPALMHMIGHSLAKSFLFFGAGEFLLMWHTTKIELLGNVIHRQRKTAVLFLLALLALLAAPPSVLFMSELLLIGYGMNTFTILTLFVLLSLTVIAIGMLRHVLAMLFGHVPDRSVLSTEGNKMIVEKWNLTHGVMIAQGLVLLATGIFFLTEEGMRFLVSIAEHLI